MNAPLTGVMKTQPAGAGAKAAMQSNGAFGARERQSLGLLLTLLMRRRSTRFVASEAKPTPTNVFCGRRADEWCFNFRDDDTAYGFKFDIQGPYSLRVNEYSPRCVQCHWEYEEALLEPEPCY